jgi:hypothetical protein
MILKTVLVSDTQYIDVILVDGKKYTQLLHKIAEPNIFGVLKQQDGYAVDTILNDSTPPDKAE